MQTTPTQSMSPLSVWLDATVRRPDGSQQSLMGLLFSRLEGLYPGRWRQCYPSPEAVMAWEEAWSEGFVEERVDPHEIKRGIANCRRMYDWPPSYKEFLRACRPYTDPEIAYREAVAGMSARNAGQIGEWSHPAVYWAAVRVNSRDLLNASWSVLKSRWEEALRTELSRDSWESVPAPAAALPAPGAAVSTVDEGARKVADLLSKAAQPWSGDPKAWARRVLDNPRRSTPTTAAMARKVIGLNS